MYMQDDAMHEFRGVQGNLQGQEDSRGVLKIFLYFTKRNYCNLSFIIQSIDIFTGLSVFFIFVNLLAIVFLNFFAKVTFLLNLIIVLCF